MNENNILELLRKMAAKDLRQAPANLFAGQLRRSLLEQDFVAERAETIAARVAVSLPEDMSPDTVLEMARCFAVTVGNMRQALAEQGFAQPERAVAEMALHMSLKLN